MIQINEFLLPIGHENRPGYPMHPEGVIFHATSNYAKSAGDELHAKYLLYTAKNKSWHVTVDHDSATKHIPFNENAWAAGDGQNGEYNRKWIHVEIACNQTEAGKMMDRQTYQNAVDVLAQIVIEFGFEPEQVQPHEVVYGKNCPQETLFDRDEFKTDIFDIAEDRAADPLPTIQSRGNTVMEDGSEQVGYLINNQLHVPLRFVTAGLGGKIKRWDNSTKTAYISK